LRVPSAHPGLVGDEVATDLLADLATITRNTLQIGDANHTFTRTTTPTALQSRALELPATKPNIRRQGLRQPRRYRITQRRRA